MKSITLEMMDGTKKIFKHTGRPGGSYSKSLRYEIGFVVIVDEYGNETAFPSSEIREIKVENLNSVW